MGLFVGYSKRSEFTVSFLNDPTWPFLLRPRKECHSVVEWHDLVKPFGNGPNAGQGMRAICAQWTKAVIGRAGCARPSDPSEDAPHTDLPWKTSDNAYSRW